jgi:hypothetical protein
MQSSWFADDRPRWRARIVYRLLQAGLGRTGALRLEDAIVATGRARAPGVALRGGEVVVTMLVKAADHDEATRAAVAAVDSAGRQACGVTLGEVVAGSAVPEPELLASAR